MDNDQIANYVKNEEMIESQHYLTVDIGGGTVDIVAHFQDASGNFESLASPKGSLLGSTAINIAFKRFLADLVEDPNFRSFLSRYNGDDSSLEYIVFEKFEEQKTAFGHEYSESMSDECLDQSIHRIGLHSDFEDFYKRKLSALCVQNVTYRRNCLRISKRIMKRFFDESTRATLDLICSVIGGLGDLVKKIFLVGGFGGCKYMYYTLTRKLNEVFPGRKFCVLAPARRDLAIVFGAVKYRKNPKIIKSRKAPLTIGVGCALPFKDGVHDIRYKEKNSSGHSFCNHLFCPYITIGETLMSDEVKQGTFTPFDVDQSSAQFNLYSTEEASVFYTRTPNNVLSKGLYKIASVHVLSPGYGFNRPIKLSMDYSQTELQVHAKDEKSTQEVNVVVDFL